MIEDLITKDKSTENAERQLKQARARLEEQNVYSDQNKPSFRKIRNHSCKLLKFSSKLPAS